MSNENFRLSLSAVMDDVADELELRRVLTSAGDDVMATWSRYQIARSIIRNEVVFPKLDIASVVADVIAKEELSSKQSLPIPITGKLSGFWRHITKVAIAASIMAVTLSTVYFFNDKEDITEINNSYAQDGATVEGLNVATNEQWVEQKLLNFVDRHEQQGVLAIDAYDQATTSETVTN